MHELIVTFVESLLPWAKNLNSITEHFFQLKSICFLNDYAEQVKPLYHVDLTYLNFKKIIFPSYLLLPQVDKITAGFSDFLIIMETVLYYERKIDSLLS